MNNIINHDEPYYKGLVHFYRQVLFTDYRDDFRVVFAEQYFYRIIVFFFFVKCLHGVWELRHFTGRRFYCSYSM